MSEHRQTARDEQTWLGLRLPGSDGDEEDLVYDEDCEYLCEDHENDVCVAVDLQACCVRSAQPLIRCAVDVAESAGRAMSLAAAGECAAASAALTRLLAAVSGLLAQVHAILPGTSRTDALRLLCPLGRLSAALSQFRALGCPWTCAQTHGGPDRRAEFEPLGGLLQECAAAVQAAVGFARPPRWGW